MPNRRYTEFSTNKLSGSPKRPSEGKGVASEKVNVKQGCFKPNLPGKASNAFAGFKKGSKMVIPYTQCSGIN